MQLTRLIDRVELEGAPLWVTFDAPQSRSLLAGRDVIFVPFTRPRDAINVVRNVSHASKILKRHNVVEVVSTGSGIALSFLPLARLHDIPCHYIESAARSMGPSVTGRTLQWVPGVNLYTQYTEWASPRWRFVDSVVGEFEPGPLRNGLPSEPLSVVVTLGTLPFRFDRLVDAVRAAARPEWQIVWQIGPNDYGPLPGRTESMLSSDEFRTLCRDADVVISHSGVGSALTALEAGRHPILAARSPLNDEHVDAHQRFVGRELDDRGVATFIEPESLTTAAIEAAAQRTVAQRSTIPTIHLRRPPQLATT
jgi:UDP-N-acetylglucosamine--N-acetylmuramyl-(pentapeptide) pyrophosphoryl-undecaprenol N-acetylglucosamine transferase